MTAKKTAMKIVRWMHTLQSVESQRLGAVARVGEDVGETVAEDAGVTVAEDVGETAAEDVGETVAEDVAERVAGDAREPVEAEDADERAGVEGSGGRRGSDAAEVDVDGEEEGDTLGGEDVAFGITFA